MTAHDWLTVMALTLVLVASIALDVVRRRMDHRHANRTDTAQHRRLLRELDRLP